VFLALISLAIAVAAVSGFRAYSGPAHRPSGRVAAVLMPYVLLGLAGVAVR
jgi:hypothetical protein